jgi:hypothetical protein
MIIERCDKNIEPENCKFTKIVINLKNFPENQ